MRTGIPILPNRCLILPIRIAAVAAGLRLVVILSRGSREPIVKNTSNRALVEPGRTEELKAELASIVARHIGSSEKLATAIPRLTLHRRTAPTGGCPVTYEPSVIVIPQGRGASENNRRAKFYRLTAAGRKHLQSERERWTRLAAAVGFVMASS